LVISGAGPTLCAICDDEETAFRVAAVMHDTYDQAGIPSVARQTQVSDKGAYILH
jgi:homoserine kinase